jgi:5-methylcytosine-specific restriction protein B
MKIDLYLRMKNARAEGIHDTEDNSVLVKQGALIEKEITEGFKDHNYLPLRKELIASGIIEDYVLRQDYLFNSPTAAAAVIGGRPVAGPLQWKLKSGLSLKQFQVQQEHLDMFRSFLEQHETHRSNSAYMRETESFVAAFPVERLRQMTLMEYDRKKQKDTFCYLLEYETKSVSGGSFFTNRNKLFFHQEDDVYDCAKFIKDKHPKKTLDELFDLYRNDLYEFVTTFDAKTYVSRNMDILPRGANYIKSKLINLYYPNQHIYIDSVQILSRIADYFHVPYKKHADAIEVSIALEQFFQQTLPPYNTMTIKDFTDVLWMFDETYIHQTEPEEIIEPESTVSEELFMDDETIQKIVTLMKRKKNIILQGTPGVGKTFSIKKIIKQNFEIDNAEEQIRTIQFHQSYSYEEFIEGLRPTSYDSGFAIEPGVFKQYIDDVVAKQPSRPFFLIIDEINRGNLSKIFGELLMLIEHDKRGVESVILPYSKEEFTVPSNLYIIGTMNTADRSLALMDYALRRRFSFVTLKPLYHSPRFTSQLEAAGLKQPQIKQIIHTMNTINQEIRNDLGENFEIGHSYFVDSDVSDFDQWYQNILEFDIIPILQEYYFDDHDKVSKFLEDLGLID